MRLEGGGVCACVCGPARLPTAQASLVGGTFRKPRRGVVAQAAGGAAGLEGAAAVAQDVEARPLAAEGDLRARISGTEAAAVLASRGQEVADLPRDTIRVAPAPVSGVGPLRPAQTGGRPQTAGAGRPGALRPLPGEENPKGGPHLALGAACFRIRRFRLQTGA
ncbi:hypothetical protein VULLAG_LOCUS22245 [Vulpes lagopus]